MAPPPVAPPEGFRGKKRNEPPRVETAADKKRIRKPKATAANGAVTNGLASNGGSHGGIHGGSHGGIHGDANGDEYHLPSQMIEEMD